jgi:hypothetical protein
MILNRQNTKLFSEQFQPKGLNYLLLGEATMEPIINQVAALQQDQYFLVMSGILARAERSYIAQKFWRIEVRSGTHKKQRKSKEGAKQASTQAPVF